MVSLEKIIQIINIQYFSKAHVKPSKGCQILSLQNAIYNRSLSHDTLNYPRNL
jgi:hypothetical protein